MLVIAFILGAIIGSFLNVVVYRLPRGLGLGGRSVCPYCHRQLKWFDLVPVFSFLFLRARCRTCRERISIRYPLVELCTGMGFALGVYLFPFISAVNAWHLCIWVIFWCICTVTFLVDIDHLLILDSVTFVGTLLVLFATLGLDIAQNFTSFTQSNVVWAIVAGLVGPLPFLFLWYISKGRWIGFGDVKFMVFLGCVLGAPLVFVAQLFSFWIGAAFAVPLLAIGKRGLKSKLPFGTFLVLGGVAAYVWGPTILDWYLGLLGI